MSESIWDDPRITAYVLGELPDAERVEFERQLESDGELAAAVDEARSVTGQLEQLYASEPDGVLDDDRRTAIVAGDSTPSVDDRPNHDLRPQENRWRSWTVPALALATAAALLLLIGVAPWIKQQENDEMMVGQVPQPAASDRLSEIDQQPISGIEGARPMDESMGEAMGMASDLRSADEVDGEGASRGRGAKEDSAPESGPTVDTLLAIESSRSAGSDAARSDRDFDGVAAAQDPTPQLMKSPSRSMSRTPIGNSATDSRPARPYSPVASQPFGNAPMELPAGEAAPARTGIPESSAVYPRSAVASEVKDRSVQVRQQAQTELQRERAVEAYRAVRGEKGKQLALGDEEIGGPTTVPLPTFDFAEASGGARGRIARGQEPELALGISSGKVAPATPDYGLPIDKGRGPGIAGDRFEPITDNPFRRVVEHPLSTFSVDVDTASYSKVRDYLLRAGQLPRPDVVRIEELLNYFDYEYDPPSDTADRPFSAQATVTGCPWNPEHRLARIALKGKLMQPDERPPCNLVFLLDTSGSMNAPNKLPLVIEGMQMLLKQLKKDDRVAITVYAGSAGLVLDSTPVKKQKKIRKALTQLRSGGSTNGGAGIALAYQTARDNFITEGVNRVILCTDGDFNVGTTGTDELVRMVEQEAKGGIFLSVLGFGMGNHNDAMLEKISGRGNGNYAFIDNQLEAKKVLVDQTNATLVTIAKDVKLQIEFNPKQVSSYRLIGYENRLLAKEDFKDDKKDAGEIGAGHAVTALYEIVPAGVEPVASGPEVNPLEFQTEREPTEAADSGVMMKLKLSYKQPDGENSTDVAFPVADDGGGFDDADHDIRFAAAVASFGMQLRRSDHAGSWTMRDVLRVAEDAKGEDVDGLRAEFVEIVRKASELMGQQ